MLTGCFGTNWQTCTGHKKNINFVVYLGRLYGVNVHAHFLWACWQRQALVNNYATHKDNIVEVH